MLVGTMHYSSILGLEFHVMLFIYRDYHACIYILLLIVVPYLLDKAALMHFSIPMQLPWLQGPVGDS